MPITQSIEHYQKHERGNLDRMIKYYQQASFDEALESATFSQTPDEDDNLKMDTHQNRVGYKKSEEAKPYIEVRVERISNAKSWNELFTIAEEIRNSVYELGHLWSYDFALRVGANLGLYPDEVFLHRGAKEGARRLLHKPRISSRSLPLTDFPDELVKALKHPYVIEGFLCCRKDDF